MKTFIALLATLTLGACARNVEWQEEVLLNTGETIWVTKASSYRIQESGGNPLDLRYLPAYREKTSFTWHGKQYVYDGEADLMLIAISAAGYPVLVAPAANKTWDWKNNYRCTTPHYVQLIPDAEGTRWTWPPHIEPWLYGLPRNLMAKRGKMEELRARYTRDQKQQGDVSSLTQNVPAQKIDPGYTESGCDSRP